MTDALRAAVQRLADMMTSDLDYHVAHEGEDLEVRTAQGWVSMRGYAASLRYSLAEHPAHPEPAGDEREALVKVMDGDPYTLARWVEATECEDVACHDDHPHLIAVETPTATAPSEPTDGRSAARLRRGLERLWVAAASSEQRDDEIDLLREDRDLIAAALAARSTQSAAEVES
jgi:hypothetical protein